MTIKDLKDLFLKENAPDHAEFITQKTSDLSVTCNHIVGYSVGKYIRSDQKNEEYFFDTIRSAEKYGFTADEYDNMKECFVLTVRDY